MQIIIVPIGHNLVFFDETTISGVLAFYSSVLPLSKLTREPARTIPKKICEQVCPTCGSEHLIKMVQFIMVQKYQCKACSHQSILLKPLLLRERNS